MGQLKVRSCSPAALDWVEAILRNPAIWELTALILEPSREKARIGLRFWVPHSVPRTGPGRPHAPSSNSSRTGIRQRSPVPRGSGGGADACGLATPGDSLPAGRDFKRKDDAWCGGSFGRALGLEGRPWRFSPSLAWLRASWPGRTPSRCRSPTAVFVGDSLVLDWVLGPRPLRQRPDHEHPVNEC